MFWPSLLLYEHARYRQQELLQTAARNQLANSYRRVRRRQAKRGPGLLTRAARSRVQHGDRSLNRPYGGLGR